MTPLVFLCIAVAGGFGAATRLFVDGLIKAHTRAAFPLATLLINVSGSLALGLLTGLAMTHLVSTTFLLVLGTGFLGGYTTFSTASFESVRLLQERRYLASLANGLGMAVLCVAAAAGGFWLGSLS